MIDLKAVKLRLGTTLIFDDFNFKVDKGEKVGIIGGEGSGKSTLLDIIAGREYPDSGKVRVTGQIVTINRNIYANSIEMAILSPSERFKLTMTKVLDESDSDDKILLLDEPTKNLNSDEVDWLIDSLKDADNLTVVVASNDRYFLKKVTTRTVTLGDSNVEKITLHDSDLTSNSSDEMEDVLEVENLLKMVDGEIAFQRVSFTIVRGQKVALVGKNEVGKTKLLKALGSGIEVRGNFTFAQTVKVAYMPRVFSSAAAKTELEKLQTSGANFLILDNPTVCLDLLTIIELEKALRDFNGTVIFADSDHEFIQAVANRIINLTTDGTVDRISTYEEFLTNETVKEQITEKYK